MLPHQSTIHGTKSQIHLQFHVEIINRAGGKDYCPLAVAFVDIEHEKDVTAPHVVYTKLQCEGGLLNVWPNECWLLD
jgi:hypothetical protein